MVEVFTRTCLRNRWIVFGLLLSLSVLAAKGLDGLAFDNSLEVWFLEGDPGIQRYQEFLDQFETDQVLVMAWETEDAFSDKTLERLRRLERKIVRVPHVVRVISLASASIPRDEVGDLAVGRLFDPPPKDPTLKAARRKAALESPFLTTSLVAPDGRAVAVVIDIEHRPGEFKHKRTILDGLEPIVESERALDGTRITLAGAAVLDRAFFDYTERDMLLFFPLIFLAICVSILVLFRRLATVVIPLAVVFLALLWTVGLQGWLGWKITVVSSILIPLVMAIGIADAIHVLTEYLDQLGLGADRPGRSAGRRTDATVASLRAVWRPCLFTSLTTAAGFLSLLVSPILPVRQLGILAAVGVLLTFLITVTLVPILLSLVRLPPERYLERMRTGIVSRLLAALEGGGRRRAWISVGVGGGLVGLAVVGLFQLRIGTNMLEFFPPGDPARQTTETVDRLVGGSVSVEYLIQADGEHGFLTPDRLARLDRFGEYLRDQPNVTGVHGLPEILKELDAAVRGVPAYEGRVPTTRPQIAQYMMLLEGNDDVRRLYRKKGQIGRFSLRVKMVGSAELSERVPEIDRHRISTIETPGFVLPGTGMVPLMNRMELHLLDSQVRSFALALVVITAMMILLLGSLRLGLFGMIPNLTPVLVTLGVMGWAGIRLDVATVMIASVVLGLVVDDTIHLLTRMQRELDSVGGESYLAVDLAIRGVGRPILVTSLVLVLGFWTLLFASFQPNINFGFLSGVTIFTALVADLVVLPGVLRLIRPRFAGHRS